MRFPKDHNYNVPPITDSTRRTLINKLRQLDQESAQRSRKQVWWKRVAASTEHPTKSLQIYNFSRLTRGSITAALRMMNSQPPVPLPPWWEFKMCWPTKRKTMHQIIFQYVLHTFCGRLAAEVERVSEGGCQQQQWQAAGWATGAGGRQLLVRRTGSPGR